MTVATQSGWMPVDHCFKHNLKPVVRKFEVVFNVRYSRPYRRKHGLSSATVKGVYRAKVRSSAGVQFNSRYWKDEFSSFEIKKLIRLKGSKYCVDDCRIVAVCP